MCQSLSASDKRWGPKMRMTEQCSPTGIQTLDTKIARVKKIQKRTMTCCSDMFRLVQRRLKYHLMWLRELLYHNCAQYISELVMRFISFKTTSLSTRLQNVCSSRNRNCGKAETRHFCLFFLPKANSLKWKTQPPSDKKYSTHIYRNFSEIADDFIWWFEKYLHALGHMRTYNYESKLPVPTPSSRLS